MFKQPFQTIRVTDTGLFNALMVASIGLLGLVAEGTVLSWQGHAASAPLLDDCWRGHLTL